MAFLADSASVVWKTDQSDLDLMDQLYTARGSQGAMIGSWLADKILTDPAEYNSTFVITDSSNNTLYWNYPMRAIWTAHYTPTYLDLKKNSQWALINIPYFSFIANCNIDDIYLTNLIIQVNDPDDTATIDKLAKDL